MSSSALSTVKVSIVSTLAAVVISSGCAGLMRGELDQHTAPEPAAMWEPPAEVRARAAADTADAARELPPEIVDRRDSLTLEQIVDIALRNNPQTRASWNAARASAARYKSEQGAYYPQLEARVDASKARGSVAGGRFSYDQFSYGPEATLTWLLFDFGRRGAEVESAHQALYATNFSHNATVQNTVLAVEQAYFSYLYAKALRDARREGLEEAERNLRAAGDRHGAGLATITDVLQARTERSQALLDLQEAEGRVKTIRGSLATAMGLPADIDFDVGFLPNELPVENVDRTIESLIDEAVERRPDLAAARARVAGSEAELSAARAERYPSVSLQGSLGREYFNSRDRYSDNKRASLWLSVPLFTGFSNQYDVLEAEAAARESRERAEALRRQVVLDVWISYYDLRTAARSLETSRDLLESATESHNAAEERYRAGVGSILELLNAQTALEDARARNVQARADWFMALAQLAHDTGSLWLDEPESAGRKNNNLEE